MSVRVRFAPSPTGYLHVGGARTALYNYLFAKHFGGKFIYRIEDTDLERSTDVSLRMQIQDMVWLGLKWDEGPDPATLKDIGDAGPYRQSLRKLIYQEHAERLISQGSAFYCFLSDEDLEKMKQSSDPNFQVRSPYRDWTLEQAQEKIRAGEKPVVRFKTPNSERTYKLNDLIRGEVEFPSTMVGDFVLIRSNGMPVYNFCCVVDDALMKISHVLRAEEHLNNTLRQIMIYEAFGYPIPQFGHLSIILGGDKKKLSKRHGATSCNEYFESGFLPEAVKNSISLLGWSHPNGIEVFDTEDCINFFSLDRMTSSPAVFDETKLRWVNSQHLKKMSLTEITDGAAQHLKHRKIQYPSIEWLTAVVKILQPRLEVYEDVARFVRRMSADGFTLDPGVDEIWTFPSTKAVLESWTRELAASKLDFLPGDFVANAMEVIKQETSVKGKNLFMPLRAAVIGQAHGVEIQDLVPLIERKELVRRAQHLASKND